MKLNNNGAFRNEFMEVVYDLLATDATNDRANQIIDMFDGAPEIEATPVIRCKDCVHYGETGDCEVHLHDGRFNANYFCADGEKKT